jgi:hypothetical protein
LLRTIRCDNYASCRSRHWKQRFPCLQTVTLRPSRSSLPRLPTEVQPIKIRSNSTSKGFLRMYIFQYCFAKVVNKTSQTRDSIPDQVKSFASLWGPLLVLLLSLWVVPSYWTVPSPPSFRISAFEMIRNW